MSSWATKQCPDCAEEIPERAKAHKCGWRMSAPKVVRHQPQGMTPEAKAAYEAAGKTSADLTEQQWYSVCMFFPKVARRARRPFADVGPHNPIHAKVRLGPLLQGWKPPRDRVPGEDDDELRSIR